MEKEKERKAEKPKKLYKEAFRVVIVNAAFSPEQCCEDVIGVR